MQDTVLGMASTYNVGWPCSECRSGTLALARRARIPTRTVQRPATIRAARGEMWWIQNDSDRRANGAPEVHSRWLRHLCDWGEALPLYSRLTGARNRSWVAASGSPLSAQIESARRRTT
jgi:hypothetical protein